MKDKILNEIYENSIKEFDECSSQGEWLDENYSVIYSIYKKYNDFIEENECENCGSLADYRWCSLNCFCSDIGL